MKNLFLLLILLVAGVSSGQALVASTSLELKKPWDRRQVFGAQNPDGTFYSFAADKQHVTCLKYNSALFFRDSLKTKIPDDDAIMSGASFGSDSRNHLYWTSPDFSKVFVVSFDFTNKSSTKTAFSFSFEKETFLGTFTDNGAFHFLTVDDEKQILRLRVFRNGYPEEHLLDFSSFEITERKGKKLKLFDAFQNFGYEIISATDFIPLSQASATIKIYPKNGSLVITFDHNPSFTQLFTIDATTYQVKERKAQQLAMETNSVSRANSFIHDTILYQVRISPKEIAVGLKILNPENTTLKNFGATADQDITFKTSALLVQNGNKKPFELATTKKFLSRLENARPAISAYPSANGIVINCGGIREIQDTGNIILGATLGIGAIAGGGGYDIGQMLGAGIIQNIYFESYFDATHNFVNKALDPIAIDFFSGFMSENKNIQNYHLSSHGKAKILTYYDAKQKAVNLRKFEDAEPVPALFDR